jgi:hypothetical protein
LIISHVYLGISTGTPETNTRFYLFRFPLEHCTTSLKVQSSSLPCAQQVHVVALSGSFPVRDLLRQRALEAMAVAAVAVEVEAG